MCVALLGACADWHHPGVCCHGRDRPFEEIRCAGFYLRPGCDWVCMPCTASVLEEMLGAITFGKVAVSVLAITISVPSQKEGMSLDFWGR